MELKRYFKILGNVLNIVDENAVYKMIDCIVNCFEKNKMVFIIGNGGSASKASHLAQDLAKGVFFDLNEGKRIRAMSLVDNIAYMTAVANDNGYENIFYAQLKTLANEGDYLIAISGSGNSKNILKAVEYAREKNIKVIGITGFDGGKLKKLSDISIHIELNEMAMVESVHAIILHYVINSLRQKLGGEEFSEKQFI